MKHFIYSAIFLFVTFSSQAQDDLDVEGTIRAMQFNAADAYGNPINLINNQSIYWTVTSPQSSLSGAIQIHGAVSDNTEGSLDTDLYFSVMNDGSLESMVLNNDGELGVGTLNPSGALHVVGHGIIMERNGGPFIRFLDTEGHADDKTWVIQGNSPNKGDLRIRNETDDDDIFIIESDGDVRVNGSIVHSSDVRKKTNIGEIDQALEKVLKLSGVTYEWKARKGSERQIGVIAQDVENVFPELVETDSDGYKSVAYSNMTAVLIEAIKEQQEIIDALSQRLALMEDRVH